MIFLLIAPLSRAEAITAGRSHWGQWSTGTLSSGAERSLRLRLLSINNLYNEQCSSLL
jgi:hypothetical protein